jgi:hypothetical protein
MKISSPAFLSLLAFVLPLGAVPLSVASYTMNNGGSGAYDYRDFTYLPCPANNCKTDNFILSGGTGKLTDGISPATSWNQEGFETLWVGWATFLRPNPPINFFFADTVTINSVTLWLDNTPGAGGVALPASVSIGSHNFSIPLDNLTSGPRGYTFSGLDITGSSVDVQLFDSSLWIMLGEVSFDGVSSTVPEPATWALLAGGIGLLLLVRKNRTT